MVVFLIGYWYMSVNCVILLWFLFFVVFVEVICGLFKLFGLVLLWWGIMGIVIVIDFVVMVWWGW